MQTKQQSHYQKSQLVSNAYFGCDLGTNYYRESNVIKMNRLLCKAFNLQHSVYVFEILDNPEDLTRTLNLLRSQNVFYARMNFDHKTVVAIFTTKGIDFAIGEVDSISNDYLLIYKNELKDFELEEVAFHLYQLCLHVPDTFHYKAKRFTSTNLDDDDKRLCLTFQKVGVVESVSLN